MRRLIDPAFWRAAANACGVVAILLEKAAATPSSSSSESSEEVARVIARMEKEAAHAPARHPTRADLVETFEPGPVS